MGIRDCFWASLESPERETGSRTESQAASEPSAGGQAGEEGGSPSLHFGFQAIPVTDGPLWVKAKWKYWKYLSSLWTSSIQKAFVLNCSYMAPLTWTRGRY